ncbi:MAG: heavy metal-binding domain-containing protein [Planctomycetes bacterium]|nr:heavy metal-binding domain-containing protein [Planctomycetota bacterium]
MNADLVILLISLGISFVLLVLGWIVGRAREQAHMRDLDAREAAAREVLLTGLRSFPLGADPRHGAVLVSGECVIATDYFKTFAASLKKIFGGELTSFETLMDRARREATMRMVEQARQMGYDAVCNVRLEGVDISGTGTNPQAQAMAAATVFGTAYKRAV